MISIHVGKVTDLRSVLSPIAGLSHSADIKCSDRGFSVIVHRSLGALSVVTALRLSPQFFTSFDSPLPFSNIILEYRANFNLRLFFTNISSTPNDDFSVTISLTENGILTPVKFQDPHSNYVQYSGLVLAQPHNVDIPPIDLSIFFAIRSTAFRNLLLELLVQPDESIFVIVKEKEALFQALRKEITLSTENKDCIIGGIGERVQIVGFIFCPTPMKFFNEITYRSKFVWFFKTPGTRCLLSSCVHLYASYVVSFT